MGPLAGRAARAIGHRDEAGGSSGRPGSSPGLPQGADAASSVWAGSNSQETAGGGPGPPRARLSWGRLARRSARLSLVFPPRCRAPPSCSLPQPLLRRVPLRSLRVPPSAPLPAPPPRRASRAPPPWLPLPSGAAPSASRASRPPAGVGSFVRRSRRCALGRRFAPAAGRRAAPPPRWRPSRRRSRGLVPGFCAGGCPLRPRVPRLFACSFPLLDGLTGGLAAVAVALSAGPRLRRRCGRCPGRRSPLVVSSAPAAPAGPPLPPLFAYARSSSAPRPLRWPRRPVWGRRPFRAPPLSPPRLPAPASLSSRRSSPRRVGPPRCVQAACRQCSASRWPRTAESRCCRPCCPCAAVRSTSAYVPRPARRGGHARGSLRRPGRRLLSQPSMAPAPPRASGSPGPAPSAACLGFAGSAARRSAGGAPPLRASPGYRRFQVASPPRPLLACRPFSRLRSGLPGRPRSGRPPAAPCQCRAPAATGTHPRPALGSPPGLFRPPARAAAARPPGRAGASQAFRSGGGPAVSPRGRAFRPHRRPAGGIGCPRGRLGRPAYPPTGSFPARRAARSRAQARPGAGSSTRWTGRSKLSSRVAALVDSRSRWSTRGSSLRACSTTRSRTRFILPRRARARG